MRTLFTLFLVLAATALAETAPSASPRLLVHLLGYIKQDYPGAVKNGAVISETEYSEQLEFVGNAVQTSRALPSTSGDPEVRQGLLELERLVREKADGERVAKVAQAIEARVIGLSGLQVAPTRWPDLPHGKALYAKNCVQCHGASGMGDGPSSGSLKPPPANFHDAKMGGTSPFQAFNAIRLGVPGTAMAAFGDLSDTDVWDLAFYVSALRHEGDAALAADVPEEKALSVDLKQAARLSDDALAGTLAGTDAEKRALIARIRLRTGRADDAKSFLPVAKGGLQDALAFAKKGDWASAKQAAIVAYLEGLEPVEPRLRARDAAFTVSLEGKMAAVRAAIEGRATPEVLEAKIADAQRSLDEADALLGQAGGSPAVTFAVAAGIFLREAFEAVLLLVTLLGVIKSLGSRRAEAYVHAGWISAIVVGLVAWAFSGWVMAMSGAKRELLEGVVSLAAVLVLLYFGFWLHRRTEIGRWRSFINDMVKTAVEGKRLSILAAVSFMAVFREAFETVLFLRALLIEAGPRHELAVGAGVLVAFVVVLVLASLLVRFSVRIPVRQLFTLSSLVMVGLALILVGKAMHAFQETGLLSITALPLGLRSDLIGLYPTYETLIPQLLLLGISALVWVSGRRLRLIGE